MVMLTSALRTLAMVVLNSITIFSTTKYYYVLYNSGVKTIFFSSTATMHGYF